MTYTSAKQIYMESLKKSYLMQIILVTLLTSSGTLNARHGCGSISPYSYDWAGHANWFMAPATGFEGILINMKTFTVTKTGGAATPVQAYEGTSIASSDGENVLFYTNGRNVYSGSGSSTSVSYNGLLTGNENGTLNVGSGTQGVITVRHPMNTGQYHVFTTDDAISNTVGLNHFILDNEGKLISGPTRLGTYRSAEGIAATLHSNGYDIWLATTDVSGFFNAYLITCNGIDTANSNLNQPGVPALSGSKERGGMAFSWDRTKMAASYSQTWPHSNEAIVLYDFDNSTGTLSNLMNIAPSSTLVNPSDIVFSPDNNRLYISQVGGTIDYLDLSSGVVSTISNSLTSTGISTPQGRGIEIGPNGKLFLAGGIGGGLLEVNEDINNDTTFTTSIVPGTSGYSSLGLPTMFIPSHEIPIIQFVEPVCYNTAPVDLNTLWHCANTDAEIVPHIYTGTGITDSIKGIFDPSVTGEGLHMVTFINSNCSSNTDDLFITVKNDSTCVITSTMERENKNSVIYPNPVHDYLYIGTNTSIQIYSPQGALVLETTASKVNVSTLKPGIYQVLLKDDNGHYRSQKLVKN